MDGKIRDELRHIRRDWDELYPATSPSEPLSSCSWFLHANWPGGMSVPRMDGSSRYRGLGSVCIGDSQGVLHVWCLSWHGPLQIYLSNSGLCHVICMLILYFMLFPLFAPCFRHVSPSLVSVNRHVHVFQLYQIECTLGHAPICSRLRPPPKKLPTSAGNYYINTHLSSLRNHVCGQTPFKTALACIKSDIS